MWNYIMLIFQMAKLAKHWNGDMTSLGWVEIERELTASFTVTENLT